MSAHAKPSVIPIRPPHASAGSRSATEFGTATDLEASCLEVPIRALGYRASSDTNGEVRRGERFEEDSTTMLLFPRGAVIRLAARVVIGQDLMLINKRNNRYVHCRVTSIRTTPEVSYIGIEFTHNTSDFWGITPARDAAKAVTVVESFAAQVLDKSQDANAAGPMLVPARSFAAAASVATPWPETVSPTTGLENTGTVLINRPSLPEEPEERTPEPVFFASHELVVPVCEPVPVPVEPRVLAGQSAEVAAAGEAIKWEAISLPQPRDNRKRIAAAGLAAVCAILLGYRFYAPAQAALPVAPPVVVTSPNGDGPQSAGATAGGAAASNSPQPVSVVTATAPEITTVEEPHQRVVLVSRMNMPAKAAAGKSHDAPELSAAAGDAFASRVTANASGLLGGANSAPPPPPEPAPEPKVETLMPAHLLTSVQPIYPAAARQAQIQGDVVVEATIGASGNVTAMKVISGSQALRAAATAALAKWKFQPAMLGETPTESTTTITLHFRLR